MTKIELDIEAKDLEFAERAALQDCFNDADDFLSAILNAAIIEWREKMDDMTPEQEEAKRLQATVDFQKAKISVLMDMLEAAQKRNFLLEECVLDPNPVLLNERHYLSEFEEDPGGGMRLKSDGESEDMDDGIPF